MNFKNKTIYKYFLINQLTILDIDIKNEIKKLVKIRLFKAPTKNDIESTLNNKIDDYYRFKNENDFIFISKQNYTLSSDKDLILNSIAFTICNNFLLFQYGPDPKYYLYLDLEASHVNHYQLIHSTTSKLLYSQHRTEFTPDTLFYVL